MSAAPQAVMVRPPLARLAGYFFWLGCVGFGGPIALVGRMQRDLVDERSWMGKQEFLDGLALAQLAPGPLAAQLAMYLGYVHSGFVGATVIAIAFVLPSFLMVWAIAAAYVHYSGLAWVQAAFYGVAPAAIAVIAIAATKLAARTLQRDYLLWLVFLTLAVTTAITQGEIVWLFLAAGFLVALVRQRDRIQIRPVTLSVLPVGTMSVGTVSSLFLFFAKSSLFVFGSGLAIVPFLYGGVVQEHNWLTEQQFVDAVAVAMITPGPVVITVAFIGYLVAAFAGAVAAALGVFLPVYLVVILLAPIYRRVLRFAFVRGFVAGVTAAAAGAIMGAALVLARRSIVDLPTATIALFALLALRLKTPEAAVIAIGALAGFAVRMLR